jgi:Ca2+-transporting ATPase
LLPFLLTYSLAPALQKADIGVAMGLHGTDLAKDAASMVILDDDFSTLVCGISESRKLFDNLRKSIQFYLACKLALVALFLTAGIFALPFPLAPIQVILLELFMDLGASTTFVIEGPESDIMTRAPRNPKQRFLSFSFNTWVVIGGLCLFCLVLFSFLMGNPTASISYARSMAFTAWMFGHWLLAFNFRTLNEPVVYHGLLSNPLMFLWVSGTILFYSIPLTISQDCL